jgi:DNA-binding transcriptional MerR regulator
MNELFPWENKDGAASVDPALAQDAPEPPQPAVQPDGDPREMEQTTPPDATPPGEPGEPDERDPGEPKPAEPQDARTPPHGDPLRPPVRDRTVARKEYYSIGEVSELVGLPAHVLRYWESQFSVLNPSKNRSGNRVYQRKEIKLILLVKQLLHVEKYTVEGAKQRIDQLRKGGGLPGAAASALDDQMVAVLREELVALRDLLAPGD